MRERGLVSDAGGVVASGDEELTCDLEADAVKPEQGRGERGEQRPKVVVEPGYLGGQGLDSAGDAGQGSFGRGGRVNEPARAGGALRER